MTDLFAWAAERRDSGMALAAAAEEGAQPGWHQRAYQAIVALATEQATIHVDDLLRRFPEPPAHPNAWGAVWMRAIRERVIEHSGMVKPCRSDPGKHAHNYPVYRSKIRAFDPDADAVGSYFDAIAEIRRRVKAGAPVPTTGYFGHRRSEP